MKKIDNIQVAPNKLLLKMWVNEKLKARSESLSKLSLTPEQVKTELIKTVQDEIGSKSLVKAEILNVGPGCNPEMDYKVGDYVYVFPHTFDADFSFDGVGYFIYPERVIFGKEKVPMTSYSEPTTEVSKTDSGIILN